MTKQQPNALICSTRPLMHSVIENAGFSKTRTLADANLVVMDAGPDIFSNFYGRKKHEHAGVPDFQQDQRDALIIRMAMSRNIPVVGVARGAHLIHALMGGDLYQHVDGHRVAHDMSFGDTVLPVPSYHSQMMRPNQKWGGKVIGWSNASTKREYRTDNALVKNVVTTSWSDPEIILYDDQKALCVQFDPTLGAFLEAQTLFTDLIWDNLV